MKKEEVYDSMFRPKLFTNLCVPSTVHAYSLAVEFIRDWFLSKFDKGFFPTVYVNGSHVFSDFKRFNSEQNLKKAKPMVAIVPEIDTDFNREYLDTYMASPSVLLTKNNFNKTILQDLDNNIFMGIGSELLFINFTFTIRTDSRSKELDLWKYIQLYFRIGATENLYLDLDFHIPTNLMYAIADLAGFELLIDEDKKPCGIKDIYKFLQYINSCSSLPITYKLRAINGNSEFFIRVPNQVLHISIPNNIDVGEGDLNGMVYDNFDLRFGCELRIPAPKYYFLYATEETKIPIQYHEIANIGIDNFKITKVPEVNLVGWKQYINTEYVLDNFPNVYPYTIPLRSFFNDDNMTLVINDCLNQGITPDIFLDIKVWNDGDLINTTMNWDTKEIVIKNPVHNLVFFIAVYRDQKYYNEKLINLKQYNKNRIVE